MSVIGEKVAVVSLGPACQTSYQIRKHLRLLRSLTQDPTLEIQALPFDNIVCPPTSLADVLTRGDKVPRREHLKWRARPYWEDANVYFWHHFAVEAAVQEGADFEATRTKFLRRWERLDDLYKSHRRLIFIISNVQNSLGRLARRTQTFQPSIKASDVVKIEAALRQVVGRPFELILITNESRFASDERIHGCRVLFQDINKGSWKGDSDAWGRTLNSAFVSRPVDRLVFACKTVLRRAKKKLLRVPRLRRPGVG